MLRARRDGVERSRSRSSPPQRPRSRKVVTLLGNPNRAKKSAGESSEPRSNGSEEDAAAGGGRWQPSRSRSGSPPPPAADASVQERGRGRKRRRDKHAAEAAADAVSDEADQRPSTAPATNAKARPRRKHQKEAEEGDASEAEAASAGSREDAAQASDESGEDGAQEIEDSRVKRKEKKMKKVRRHLEDVNHSSERRSARHATMDKLDKKAKKEAKKEAGAKLSSEDLRALIRGVFQRHNPAKLTDFEGLMKKYVGAEADVYSHVCQKYGETPTLTKPKDATKQADSLAALNVGDASKVKVAAKPTFAKKAGAPAPPPSLRVVPKHGPLLSPPRDMPSAAELFAEVESSKGNHWPFMGREDSPNSSSRSSSASPARDPMYGDLLHPPQHAGQQPGLQRSSQTQMPSGVWFRPSEQPGSSERRRSSGDPSLDTDLSKLLYPRGVADDTSALYADLLTAPPQPTGVKPHDDRPPGYFAQSAPGAPPRYEPPAAGGWRPPAAPESTREPDRTPIYLQTFIGQWQDSMRSRVDVNWARDRDNRGGQLEVLLTKAIGKLPAIKLNVKMDHAGLFTCGHYNLDGEGSHTDRIVWKDNRSHAPKYSIWDRVRTA